jgi:hypothetical protein
VSRDRRLGWLLVLYGGALALGIQVALPVGVPLYDGVVVAEPYRYLHPTGDQVGEPTSGTDTESIGGGKSPILAVSTEESPPQAQLITQEDAFAVPPGTTEITASITPIDPAALPPSGSIAGNVYRFEVTNQSGMPLVPKPCEGCRSLVLRAPDDVTDGTVARFADGAWTTVTTYHAGTVAMYQVNASGLGDFAVISGSPPGLTGGIDPLLFGGIALAAFAAVVAGLFWYRRRPPPVPVARLGPGRGRVPSKKRRGPRRPPTGRSG